jgi:hypothetical protein
VLKNTDAVKTEKILENEVYTMVHICGRVRRADYQVGVKNTDVSGQLPIMKTTVFRVLRHVVA